MMFKDRREAGRLLSGAIKAEKLSLKNAIVVALPRGGVPVAYEVSKNLGIPLEVLVVRKIGARENREYALGAIAENDVVYMRGQAYNAEEIIDKEKKELARRVRKYRGAALPAGKIENKIVIIVDDGLATGATAMAAILAVKKLKPARVIFACPVGAKTSVVELEKMVDKVICLYVPEQLRAIGLYYENFGQVSDETVADLLTKC